MSATPEPVKASKDKDCWGCRAVGGGGLILSGAYVFNAALRAMKQGATGSMGPVVQIVFASSLAAWGFVILTDPVGKAKS